ncbi:hypothetical protein J6W34_03335 [bacterium]|nr:hypothetical protein [bacterium]
MDKCCWNCGHFRDGKCYCQEEINFDESSTSMNIGDYIYDMVEEGKIDSIIDEAEDFTNDYNLDCLENHKLTKKQKEEIKKEIIEIMEEKLDDFKSDFSGLFINRFQNLSVEINLEEPVNIFKVNNPKEFYCSRYWR